MTTGQAKDEEERGDGADVKKQAVEDVGGLTQCNNQIDLGAEKTVLRKLDWRIVTLTFVLCLFRPFIHNFLTVLNYQHPDLLATLDRSNIGYELCYEIIWKGTVNAYC